jgi:anti-anti-sigma factor
MTFELSRPLSEQHTADRVTVVHFAGSRVVLDAETFQGIHDQLVAITEEPGDTHFLLDFGNVEYISSRAIGALLALHRTLLAAGSHLSLGNVRPEVHDLFAVCRLEEFLDLRPGEPEAASVPEAERRFPVASVLVVDDDVAVRHVLHVGLRSRGFQVWSVGHGLQAVELYRRCRDQIDLVLLDVLMPGMDGPQTLAALQEICPDVRCCFMSGNSKGYTEEALLRLGAMRVLHKPFAFAEVFELVSRSAGRRSGRVDRWIELPVLRR